MRKQQRPHTVRILFVTPVTPFSGTSGAEQRSRLMLTALQTIAQVDVVELSQSTAQHVEVVQSTVDGIHVVAKAQTARVPLRHYSPKPWLTHAIESALGSPLSSYTLIVGRYVWPVCQLVIPSRVPVIADLDDYCYRRDAGAPFTLAGIFHTASKWVAHAWQQRQLHRLKGGFFASALDKFEGASFVAAVLPNVPIARHSLAHVRGAAGPKVLFVGSLWYRPNQEGVDWFLESVWPGILKALPEASLTLIGAASPTLRQHWAQHVHVSAPGFVDDLFQAYVDAALVVVPVLSGGGSNIKLLEALAMGRPCLVTQFSHAPFADELVADKHLLVARSSEEFASKAVACLKSPVSYQQMADAGREVVQSRFTLERFNATVIDLVNQVLA